MDHLSIVSLIGSIVAIADAVTKSIGKLSDLKSRYRNAPLQITTLVGQLYIIRAAIDQLQGWKTRVLDHPVRYCQLAAQIDSSLSCFGPLIEGLQQYLDKLDVSLRSTGHGPTRQDRFLVAWNDADMTTYLNMLDRQINALNLFLQAIQCNTWAEQNDTVEEPENQVVMQQARDCTSSMRAMNDGLSFISENTNAISLQFDFDKIILGSTAYQAAHRSHLRQAVRASHLALDPTGAGTERTSVSAAVTSSAGRYNEDDNGVVSALSSHQTDESNRTESFLSLDVANTPEQPPPSPSPSFALSLTHKAKERLQVPRVLSSLRTIAHQYQAQFGDFRNFRRSSFSSQNNHTQQSVEQIVETGSGQSIRQSIKHRPKQSVEKSVEQSPKRSFDKRVEPLENRPLIQDVLLLGTAEAGKTTISNAMNFMYGRFTERERHYWVQPIHSQIMEDMKWIVQAMRSLRIDFERADNAGHAATIVSASKSYPWPDSSIHPDWAAAISELWSDAGFQQAYRLMPTPSSEWDNLPAFVHDIHRLLRSDYLPTREDVLRARIHTQGITKHRFALEHCVINLIDVGGSRVEQKKWHHVSGNVQAVIFVADVCGYAKYTDNTYPDAAKEQLTLFQAMVNSPLFHKKTFILALTRIDCLEDVLRMRRPDVEHFPPSMDHTKENFLSHLESQFRAYIRDDKRRKSMPIIHADIVGSKNFERSVREMMDIIARDSSEGS